MVKFIDLSFNQLQLVDLNTFNGLRNLKNFKLNNNFISAIIDNSFQTLNQLTDLDLSYNRLSVIQRNTFTGLNSLQVISLKSNEIVSFDVDALTNLNNLVKIDADIGVIPTTYTSITCSPGKAFIYLIL